MAHQLSAAARTGVVCQGRRRSERSAQAACTSPNAAPPHGHMAASIGGRVALRGVAVCGVRGSSLRVGFSRSAAPTTAVFKQTTDRMQWSTIVLAAASLAAGLALLVRSTARLHKAQARVKSRLNGARGARQTRRKPAQRACTVPRALVLSLSCLYIQRTKRGWRPCSSP